MFELMFTSFPVIIRYYQLKRRGETMTVWNMRTAVFMWAVLAFGLFLLIFYFHPKSYTGLLPFRTVSVVAQSAGPVTEVNVRNGQRVSKGDLLFKIEDSSQQAALQEAEAQFALIEASEAKAADSLSAAEASVSEVMAQLDKLRVDLENAQTLRDRNVGTQDAGREAEAAVSVAEAELVAAEAQVALVTADIEATLPAQRRAAEASLATAKAALEKTQVHSYTDGIVTQLALSQGSPGSTLSLSPAMIIIPDRPEDLPMRFIAGFSQVARSTMYEGMPAEIACDSNINIGFRNAVIPARVAFLQPAVATGQVVPSGNLLELNRTPGRGSIMAYFELEYPEHANVMLDGSGCIIQTYSTEIHGFVGHVIAVTGIIKAVGLRIKVWGGLISGIGLSGGSGH